MIILWMILIATLTSLILRVARIGLLKRLHIHPEHALFTFLGYAVYAIMGGIIYTTGFPHDDWHQFVSGASSLLWVKLALLASGLIIGCYYRNFTVLVLVLTGLYAVILLWMPAG